MHQSQLKNKRGLFPASPLAVQVPSPLTGKGRMGPQAAAPPSATLTLALSRQRARGPRGERRVKSLKL